MSSSGGSISTFLGSKWATVAAVVALAAGAVAIPVVTGGSGVSCSQTFTTGTMDNSPFHGDNVNTAVQDASGGETFCFASGTYSLGVDFYNAAPITDVTLRPAAGASVIMGSITMNHVSHVIYRDFTGSSETDGVTISNSSGNSTNIKVLSNHVTGGGSAVVGNTNANAAILWQGNVFEGQDGSVTDLNRLKIISDTGCPSGIMVNANEMFGGTTDGVSIGDSCGVKVTNNYVHDIGTPVVGGCTATNGGHPHCDAFQCEASCTDLEISGNLVETTDTGFSDYDGPSSGTWVHDNTFWDVVGVGSGTINIGNTSSPIIEHNTIGGYGVAYINLGSKTGQQTTGVTVRNNITPNGISSNGDGSGATFTVSDYNMCSSGCTGTHSLTSKVYSTNYTFTGGTPPLGVFSGYALVGGSSGENVASDGTDIGVNP